MTERRDTLEQEYLMLREEIMYNQKQRDSLAQFVYTVAVADFAAAFTVNNAWIVACFLLFLIPISLKVAECGNTVAYLASYMIVFLEKEIDFSWESSHRQYYEKYKRKGIQKLINYCSRWDFVFLTLASSFLFWLLQGFNLYLFGNWIFGIVMLAIQLMAIIFEMVIAIKFSNFPKVKSEIINNWLKINKNK